MICYYQNSKGKKIDLMSGPYRLITADFFDYEWDEISYSGKIYGFTRKTFVKEVKLDVFCAKSEFARNMNHLESIFAEDVVSVTPGKLYVNDDYLTCYVKGVKKDEWEAGIYTIVNLAIVTDCPYWILEKDRKFLPVSRRTESGRDDFLNYPLNYPFNYTVSDRGSSAWYVDHIKPLPFYMIVYGPVTNPRILINNLPYEVYTTLESNEYMTIESRTHKVLKYASNGTIINLYNNRRTEQSIFEPLSPGNIQFNWSGTFGFDLTIFLEGNEPRWN